MKYLVESTDKPPEKGIDNATENDLDEEPPDLYKPAVFTKSSYFSRLVYAWFTKFALTLWRREISKDDLFPLEAELDSKNTTELFLKEWKSQDAMTPDSDFALGSLLFRIGKNSFIHAFIFEFLGELCSQMMPILISLLLSVLNAMNGRESIFSTWSADKLWYVGLLICGGMFFLQALHGILYNRSFWITYKVAMKSKVGLMGLIYDKTLRISAPARHNYSLGMCASLMSTSINRIDAAYPYFHYLWFCPIQIAFLLYMFYRLFGSPAYWVILLLVAALPLQVLIMFRMNTQRKFVTSLTDRRLKFLQETIVGIKVVKFFAWEPVFAARLKVYRDEELKEVRRLMLLASWSIVLNVAVPALAGVIGFVMYSWNGRRLEEEVVFPALTYLNMLDLPLSNMPIMTTLAVDAFAATKKLQDFLRSPDAKPKPTIDRSSPYAINIEKADFQWEENELTDEKESDMQLDSDSSTFVDNSNVLATISPELASPAPVDASGSSSADEAITELASKRLLSISPHTNYDLAEHTWCEGEDPISLFEGLKNITLQIPKGSLVAIVGPVGSGKSSLLAAIFGEMEHTAGNLTLGGGITYCPQIPWLINASLRQNILVGQTFDEQKYWRVIKECQMEEDLMALPFGDLTDLGEGGISLSGGQKARLNLARMAYNVQDIVLMDDPLSAVDNRVGKAIMEQCIMSGVLSKTTRLLATHHLGVLPNCDLVIVVKNGHIEALGKYDDLMRENSSFASLLKRYNDGHQMNPEAEEEHELIEELLPIKNEDAIMKAEMVSESISSLSLSLSPLSPSLPSLSLQSSSSHLIPLPLLLSPSPSPSPSEMTRDQDQVHLLKKQWKEEELKSQKIDSKVYGLYFVAAGGIVFLVLALFFIGINEFMRTLRDFWLSWWITFEDGFGLNLSHRGFRDWYISFAFIQTLLTWACGFVFIQGGYRASKKLHNEALASLLSAPIRFFDSTPVGRIITRFGRDLDMVDTQVADDIWYLLFAFGSMISTILLLFLKAPKASVMFLIPICMATLLQAIYRAGARQLQRLYASQFSPLMANFSETYLGLTVLHAMGSNFVDYFRDRHFIATNTVIQCVFATIALRRWTAVMCEFISAGLVSLSALACLLTRANSDAAGLILSSLVNFVFSLDWFIKQFADLEASLVAVERLHQYAVGLDAEAVDTIASIEPDKSWPSQGHVNFQKLFLSYRAGTKPVLTDLNMEIKPGERVGIVGRTGAGKSSILTAMLRAVEPSGGTIVIDGVDIRNITLSTLRSRLTIVPQDPALFAGTLRFNIDPPSIHDDRSIWSALERVGMRRVVSKLPKKLDYEVKDMGGNFSLGQRQLFCLARALLRRSKVVLMDEATASMDVETDAMIQRVIRQDFDGCTIITVAHRLGTIRDYDRIVVMDGGMIAEEGPPDLLLRDKNSRLSSLFRSSMKTAC